MIIAGLVLCVILAFWFAFALCRAAAHGDSRWPSIDDRCTQPPKRLIT